MARYKATVLSPESREAVFDYFADFRSVVEWDPSAREARLRSGEPGHAGAEFEIVSRFLGRDVPLLYRTVEVDRPQRVLLVAETSTVTSRDEITFAEIADGGTAVTYSADLRLRGPLRLLDPLLGVFFSRLGDAARDGMTARLSQPLTPERREARAR